MHCVRFAKCRGGDFRKPDRLDLAFFHQVRQGADALLDWHPLVPAVQVVNVDDIGLQALEALLAVLLDHLGAPVDLALTLRVPEHAAFGDENEFVAPAPASFAYSCLSPADSVSRT